MTSQTRSPNGSAAPAPARPKPFLADEFVKMAHGSGGKATHTLIDAVFLEAFRNPLLEKMEDQAVFTIDGAAAPRLAFTTDSFVVNPVFFPGGDIGELAVNGTINDLAISGAVPLHLSASFILEEGFPIADLKRIAESMARACDRAGVAIVTGDTKVVNRGKGDGVFINTAGIGVIRAPVEISAGNARPGDKVIVSGAIGDHGMAIMITRGGIDIESGIVSDTAPLNSLVQAMLEVSPAIHCMRDPTRGGVVTVLNEIAAQSNVGIVVEQEALPVHDEVNAACEILGIDPLHVANEGKLIAVVPPGIADAMLDAMREHPDGADAEIIGHVIDEPAGRVLLRTAFGGTRVMDMLVGDPLPRIC
ncbi:MAG TPA: hydrogenase expression/formation protein HypE [Dehalococcoidia bacterium]